MAYVAVNIGFVSSVHDPFVRVEERVRIGGPVFVMAHFVVEPVVFAGRGGFAAGFGLLAVLFEGVQNRSLKSSASPICFFVPIIGVGIFIMLLSNPIWCSLNSTIHNFSFAEETYPNR